MRVFHPVLEVSLRALEVEIPAAQLPVWVAREQRRQLEEARARVLAQGRRREERLVLAVT